MSSFSTGERIRRCRMLDIQVDPEDEWVFEIATWRLDKDGYVVATLHEPNTKMTIFMHHYIAGQPFHKGVEIDHRDRVKHNNCRSNLRYLTHRANSLNTHLVEGAWGYSWKEANQQYQVKVRGQYVGLAPTAAVAEEMRNAYLKEIEDDDDTD